MIYPRNLVFFLFPDDLDAMPASAIPLNHEIHFFILSSLPFQQLGSRTCCGDIPLRFYRP